MKKYKKVAVLMVLGLLIALIWWIRQSGEETIPETKPIVMMESPTPIALINDQKKVDTKIKGEIDWKEARYLGEEREKVSLPQVKDAWSWEEKAKKVLEFFKMEKPVTVLDNATLLMIKDEDKGDTFYFNKSNNFLQIQKQNLNYETAKKNYQEQLVRDKFKELAGFFWNNQEVEIKKVETAKKNIVDKNMRTRLVEFVEVSGFRKVLGLPLLGSWGGAAIKVVMLNDGEVFRIQVENPFTEVEITKEDIPVVVWTKIKEKEASKFLVFSVAGKDEEKEMALSLEDFEQVRVNKLRLGLVFLPKQKKYIPYYLMEGLANSALADGVEIELGVPALPEELYN